MARAWLALPLIYAAANVDAAEEAESKLAALLSEFGHQIVLLPACEDVRAALYSREAVCKSAYWHLGVTYHREQIAEAFFFSFPDTAGLWVQPDDDLEDLVVKSGFREPQIFRVTTPDRVVVCISGKTGRFRGVSIEAECFIQLEWYTAALRVSFDERQFNLDGDNVYDSANRTQTNSIALGLAASLVPQKE